MSASVASQTAAGTELSVLARPGAVTGMGPRVAEALNTVAWRLKQGDVPLTATPWERHTRFGKH